MALEIPAGKVKPAGWREVSRVHLSDIRPIWWAIDYWNQLFQGVDTLVIYFYGFSKLLDVMDKASFWYILPLM